MQSEVIAFNQTQRKKDFDMRAGDVVRVHRKIKEGGKERIQVFEGIIIAVKGRQSSSPTITVRKVSNGVGVEIIVPVFSQSVEKVEFVKRAKVRKSKLYYIRNKASKASRLKYTDKKGKDIIDEKKEEKEEKKSEETTNQNTKKEE